MNQNVRDLEVTIEGIVEMLREDFAFTSQDELTIASELGKLRDALGRWRKRQKRNHQIRTLPGAASQAP